MKKKIICVCFEILTLGLAMPYSVSDSSKSVQVSRGDKKVHSPINIHSISKNPVKAV